MVTQAFRKGFRNRAIVSLVLLGVSYTVNTSPIEWFWSKLIARTSEANYTRAGHRGEDGHGLLIEVPEGAPVVTRSGRPVMLYRFVGHLVRECTYVSLAAIMFPFFVRKTHLRGVVCAAVMTLIWVGVLNYLRLRLYVSASAAGWTELWFHDIPNYACYTLSILGAVWYYYRSTVPRDTGSEAEAAAGGSSTMTTNA